MKNQFAVGLAKMRAGCKETKSKLKAEACRKNWKKAMKSLRRIRLEKKRLKIAENK